MVVNPDDLLRAARADQIPVGWAGLWYITKATTDLRTISRSDGKTDVLPPGTYTHLFRLTDSTLYNDPPGMVVMEDTPFELRKHLQFMLRAKGRVLITGLGLGCVIRGCLANPAIEHVTCIENSPDVLKLVAPYMPTERLSIIEADALEWTALNREPFDCAWHDLWTDRDAGEPHLDLWHTRLIYNCRRQIKRQGAWAYSLLAKYWLRKAKIDVIG